MPQPATRPQRMTIGERSLVGGRRRGRTPKVLSIDLDGTLIDPAGPGVITAPVREAIGDAARAGAHVVFNSGQSVAAILRLLSTTGLRDDLGESEFVVVGSNGGTTDRLWPGGDLAPGDQPEVGGPHRINQHTFRARELVERFVRAHPEPQRRHLVIAVERQDGRWVYHGRSAPPASITGDPGPTKAAALDQILDEAQICIRVVIKDARRNAPREGFVATLAKAELTDHGVVGYSAWIDFGGGADKRRALEHLLRYLACDWKDVLHIGDGRNDLEALKAAKGGGGKAYAMGNAEPVVKASATRTLPHVAAGGAAAGLRRHFPRSADPSR